MASPNICPCKEYLLQQAQVGPVTPVIILVGWRCHFWLEKLDLKPWSPGCWFWVTRSFQSNNYSSCRKWWGTVSCRRISGLTRPRSGEFLQWSTSTPVCQMRQTLTPTPTWCSADTSAVTLFSVLEKFSCRTVPATSSACGKTVVAKLAWQVQAFPVMKFPRNERKGKNSVRGKFPAAPLWNSTLTVADRQMFYLPKYLRCWTTYSYIVYMVIIGL